LIGYIYCITNNITEETYIGRHNYKENEDWNYYMGSGRLIQEAIAQFGKENFTKTMIEECKNIETLMEREEYWLKHYKNKGKAEYNISLSGGLSSMGNYWPYLKAEDSIEISNKLSKSLKESEAHKKAILKHHENVKIKNEEKRLILIKKYENMVVDLYNNGKTMKDIANIVDISPRLIRRILVERNAVEFDKNGHITRPHTEATKRKISKTLEQFSLETGQTKYDYELLNNEKTINNIIKLYNEGKSLREIGRLYNVRGSRIKKILKENHQI